MRRAQNAPKTDVARSSLENTPESLEITRKVYDILARQIDEEVKRLAEEERYSISRAIGHIEFIGGALASRNSELSDETLLAQSFAQLQIFLLEDNETRNAVSLEELKKMGGFWTSHSPLTSSVEHLIREIPGNITARSVFKLVRGAETQLPAGNFVTNIERGAMTLDMVLRNFEVSAIRGREVDRKLELYWSLRGVAPKWYSSEQIEYRMFQINSRAAQLVRRVFEERTLSLHSSGPRRGSFLIPTSVFSFAGLETFAAVAAVGGIYLQSNVPVVEYVNTVLKDQSFERMAAANIYLEIIRNILFLRNTDESEVQARLDRMLRDLTARGMDVYVRDWESFRKVAQTQTLRLFDPSAWSKRGTSDEEEFEWTY
jgi:molecular chaperone HtpG